MAGNTTETAAPVDAALPLLLSTNIQGNILAPFNKPYQRFLFISFMNRQAEARAWLKELVGAGVASTSEVVTHNKAYAQAKENAETLPRRQWVGVSFTSSGLMTLDPGLARDLLAYGAFWQGPLVDREYRGRRTMSPAVVGDVHRGDPTDWVVGGPGQYPVDAVVTVAADDEDRLTERAKKVLSAAVDPAAKDVPRVAVLSWQDCHRRDRNKVGIEPFGFRDGISQPGVRGFTAATVHNLRRESADQAGSPIIATGEFVLGYDGEPHQFAPVQGDRAGHPGVLREQAHDRERGDRLARAGLTDDAQRAARQQVEVDAADRVHPAGLGREGDAQVANRKHREAHARPAEREAGSRASRNPSPISAMDTVSRLTRAAGTKNSHGELDTVLAPSLSIVPSETSGG
jgi:deferrochelatase/peroxidase EfeB